MCSSDLKTKPTQHSVIELRGRGIQPDAIVCRSDEPVGEALCRKISNLSSVPLPAVISAPDADSLYEIPLILHDEGLDNVVCDLLRIDAGEPDLEEWLALNRRVEAATIPVRVGLIGKYIELVDAYLSVVESLNHAGIHLGVDVQIEWIQAEDVEGLLIADRLRDLGGIEIGRAHV